MRAFKAWGQGPRLAAVALAIAVASVPLPGAAVERYYSTAVFPVLQRQATRLSNLTSAALIDVLIVACAAWLAWQTGHAIVSVLKSRSWRPAAAWLNRVAIVAAGLVLAFFTMWGFNYQRLSLVEKVRFDASSVSPGAVLALAERAVDEVNALHAPAHESGLPNRAVDPSLAGAFAEAQRLLGVGSPALPGRPKHSILDPYFKAAGVAGMTNPFFLETLVVSDLLPFERPHVIAHEWSHLAGFTDEGEANFVGWLACTKGSLAARYSGWIFLYSEVVAGLRGDDRTSLGARLHPGPLEDLRLAAERVRRNVRPGISRAGWRVYDRYLKANRVEGGTASYRDVVRLVLGIRLDREGVPPAD